MKKSVFLRSVLAVAFALHHRVQPVVFPWPVSVQTQLADDSSRDCDLGGVLRAPRSQGTEAAAFQTRNEKAELAAVLCQCSVG